MRNVTMKPLRVVEVSRGLAGSYGGWLLGRLGAAVTRVDVAPDPGTDAPPLRHAWRYFQQGKATRAAAPGCCDDADIILTDNEASLAAVTGEPVEALRARRSGLVIGVASIFGRDGPLSRLPATELDAQAVSGVAWVLGEADRTPLALPPGVLACQAGVHLAAACLAAAYGPRAEAGGRIVDVALADILASYVGVNCRFYVHHGLPFHRAGRRASGSGGAYPFVILPCADGYVCLSGRTRQEWERLVDAMGTPAWTQQDRYRNLRAMGQVYPDEVDALMTEWLQTRSKADIEDLANRYKLTISPLRTFDEILNTPQWHERRFFQSVEIEGRPVHGPSLPFKLTTSRTARPDADQAAECLARAPEPKAGTSAPLAGLRVIDLGWVWSAPQVGSILAQLGADVIKVEHGARLDNTRLSGRVIRDGQKIDGPTTEMSPMFHQINLGKRGVTLNLKDPEAVRLLEELVAASDVVIENMSPGSLERSGVGYDALKRINPSLVMLSMSGAGQFGPLSEMRTYAPAMSSFAGLEGLVGYPGEDPLGALNFALGDPNAAAHGLLAVFAGLIRRRATGEGCYIDLSQTEALLATLTPYLIGAQHDGGATERVGNRHPAMAPHGIYPAAGADRWIAIAAPGDVAWAALAGVIGEAWAQDPALAHVAGRMEHCDRLDRLLGAWSAAHDRDALVARLRGAGVPASPVQSIEDVWTDAAFAARGALAPVDLPVLGDVPMFRAPWRFSDFEPRIDRRGPGLGEHNDEVFQGLLGMSCAEVDRLRASGVIA